MKALTVSELLNLFSRSASALRRTNEHAALIGELDAATLLCQRVIGESHCGCAADEPVLQLGDELAPDSHEAEVLVRLRDAGIAARYEHPGYIAIPHKLGTFTYAFGTANTEWGGELTDETGATLPTTWTFSELPSTTTDYQAVCDAIVAALSQVLCEYCGARAEQIGEDTMGRPYWTCDDCCGTEWQTDPNDPLEAQRLPPAPNSVPRV